MTNTCNHGARPCSEGPSALALCSTHRILPDVAMLDGHTDRLLHGHHGTVNDIAILYFSALGVSLATSVPTVHFFVPRVFRCCLFTQLVHSPDPWILGHCGPRHVLDAARLSVVPRPRSAHTRYRVL